MVIFETGADRSKESSRLDFQNSSEVDRKIMNPADGSSTDVVDEPNESKGDFNNDSVDGELNGPEDAAKGDRMSRSVRSSRDSLHLRRLPVHVLFQPGEGRDSILDDSLGDDLDELYHDFQFGNPRYWLRSVCLNSRFSLRTQLVLAFGSVSALMIILVCTGSTIMAWKSGENVKAINRGSFENLVTAVQGKFARYLADDLSPRLILDDSVRIIHETVRDRFAGYPNDGDEFVPFFDVDSETNKYPIVGITGKPLPLDWQIEANVNDDNFNEHMQSRWSWYATDPYLSTASAFYIQQGMCDPSVTDSSALTYWPNCTEANNDVLTGGVVTPSPTSGQAYRKLSSLSPILKTIYETSLDIREVGVYTVNSGAGASVNYPHYLLNTGSSYVSIGCDWMREPNPYDPLRPIGTEEEIARCRPEGVSASSRLYNPLEREWCRDQALNPFRPVVDGPTLDAWYGTLVMSIGQGIYDRITNEFIGCIYVGRFLENIEELLVESKFTANSQVSVARYGDGLTVASTAWDSANANSTVHIYDLNIGFTKEMFQQLKNLVDFESTWDPTDAREQFENFIVRQNGFSAAAYPMPPIPNSYDPSYRPLFFAMLSAADKDIFRVVDDLNDTVEPEVDKIRDQCLIVAAVGLAVVLITIVIMSNTLTTPLRYMNSAADEILNHFGNTNASGKKIELAAASHRNWCTPETELNETLKEFNKMVASFSGSSFTIVKSVKQRKEEIYNSFDMQDGFKDLYDSRLGNGFKYDTGPQDSGPSDATTFVNFGTNTVWSEEIRLTRRTILETKPGSVYTSRLFLWITIMIGTPLLLTVIAISSVVMNKISTGFDVTIETAGSFYVDVRLVAISVYAKLRADRIAGEMSRPARDLHILTRYASWLLFGALEREESFTQIKTGVEECKVFSEDLTACPFYQEERTCDCAWNEHNQKCDNYSFDTRDLQSLHFVCQSSDRYSNGDLNFTNFPDTSYSPETTSWWDNVTTLPGSEKGALAAGHATTYDRLRVVSASPVHQVIYNQDVKKEYYLSSGIGFEADGMFLSFMGCRYVNLLQSSAWSSTEENRAYKLRPELCPLGKFGFDPRCREWYDTGRKLAKADDNPLYVTAPYVYADDTLGQTVTSPLIDPLTNEHVGQVYVDFVSGPIFDLLNRENTPLTDGGFPILITALSDEDSVVAPGFSPLHESARPVAELVLPYDHDCNTESCVANVERFAKIVESMKAGDNGSRNFTRTTSAGTIETAYIAYAPVQLNGYRPLDGSDFSRGVESREYTIYSLALVETEGGLLEPFQQIEDETSKQVRIAIAILSVVVLLSIVFVVYVSKVVAQSLTEPMLFLLDVIRDINRLNVDEEPPIVDRSVGSREIVSVSETVQTLYKVVRCGNVALFSGDVESAYAVLRDALRLFVHLDNKKSIGIVNNNLGNLMFVMYRTMKDTGFDNLYGMTKQDIIRKGVTFYNDAIKHGEKAYDDFHEREGWSVNCLDFMQHLSNRYFNRALFLLVAKDDHSQPDELEKLGLRDLEIARDLDQEISDSGEQAGWSHVDRVEKLLDVIQVRSKGHMLLLELGYPDEWEIGDLLDNAFEMLKKEINNEASTLFDTMTVAGWLQMLETELMKYKLLKGEVKEAAQIGIRMLVEDEYTFPEALCQAVEALLAYIETMEMDAETQSKVKSDLSAMKHSVRDVVDDMDKSRISAPSEGALEGLTALRRSASQSKVLSEVLRMSAVKNLRMGHVILEEF